MFMEAITVKKSYEEVINHCNGWFKLFSEDMTKGQRKNWDSNLYYDPEKALIGQIRDKCREKSTIYIEVNCQCIHFMVHKNKS